MWILKRWERQSALSRQRIIPPLWAEKERSKILKNEQIKSVSSWEIPHQSLTRKNYRSVSQSFRVESRLSAWGLQPKLSKKKNSIALKTRFLPPKRRWMKVLFQEAVSRLFGAQTRLKNYLTKKARLPKMNRLAWKLCVAPFVSLSCKSLKTPVFPERLLLRKWKRNVVI